MVRPSWEEANNGLEEVTHQLPQRQAREAGGNVRLNNFLRGQEDACPAHDDDAEVGIEDMGPLEMVEEDGREELLFHQHQRPRRPAIRSNLEDSLSSCTPCDDDSLTGPEGAGGAIGAGEEEAMDLESVVTTEEEEEPDSLRQQEGVGLRRRRTTSEVQPDSLSYDEDTFATKQQQQFYDSIGPVSVPGGGAGGKKLIIPYADSYSSDSFTSQESLVVDKEEARANNKEERPSNSGSFPGDIREALLTPQRRTYEEEEEEDEDDSLLLPERRANKKKPIRPLSASSIQHQHQQQMGGAQWSSSSSDLRPQNRLLPHLPPPQQQQQKQQQQHPPLPAAISPFAIRQYSPMMTMMNLGRVASPAISSSSPGLPARPASSSADHQQQPPPPRPIQRKPSSFRKPQLEGQQQTASVGRSHHVAASTSTSNAPPTPSSSSIVRMATERLKKKFLGGGGVH